ncbi:extracellular solute-binding protein [Paenibacillus sp. NPDC056579]|uniref:ABC transporter substrate-binding protein n=1 Tax=Paenibacillus sp. NPDC056579 TaxID=3345871 RepID=UPI00368FB89B
MPSKMSVSVMFLGLSTLFLSACSSDETGEKGDGLKPPEPITLRFFSGDNNFQKRLTSDKVKQKFPHITVEFYAGNTAGGKLEDLIAAGQPPDVYYQGLSGLNNEIIKYNMQYDMSELIKKTGFNMNRLDPAYLDIIRAASESLGGTYYGLPVTTFTPVLFYNKDVFDKFGVAYPKDGMTWDETYELARKLTREDAGIQYKGMTMNFPYLFDNNQLAAPYLHPKENQAIMDTDQWRSIFKTFGQFYKLPMSKPLTDRSRPVEVNDFTKDRISAMHADVTAAIESFPDDFVNWDMVSLPTMAEAPLLNAQLNPRFYYIMSSSKHKDEAFKLIEFLLTDEMQMMASKTGYGTVLDNEEIRKAYGQDFAKLKGKNTGALYVNKPVKVSPARDAKLVSVPTSSLVSKEFNAYIKDLKDVNTALRDLNEGINLMIDQEKKAASK